mmetsp:Transcript_83564/g.241778  ORF Transcript_83564/g.241778 Transcript_83564/m.241778 type:complete len:240 (+) Transcript_83564:361-1080(+)
MFPSTRALRGVSPEYAPASSAVGAVQKCGSVLWACSHWSRPTTVPMRRPCAGCSRRAGRPRLQSRLTRCTIRGRRSCTCCTLLQQAPLPVHRHSELSSTCCCDYCEALRCRKSTRDDLVSFTMRWPCSQASRTALRVTPMRAQASSKQRSTSLRRPATKQGTSLCACKSCTCWTKSWDSWTRRMPCSTSYMLLSWLLKTTGQKPLSATWRQRCWTASPGALARFTLTVSFGFARRSRWW